MTIYKKIKNANQYLLDVHDKSSNLNLYEFGFALMHEGDRMAEATTEPTLKGISSRIELELYRSVKIAAVKQDKSLADVIKEALELWLTTVTSDGTPAGA